MMLEVIVRKSISQGGESSKCFGFAKRRQTRWTKRASNLPRRTKVLNEDWRYYPVVLFSANGRDVRCDGWRSAGFSRPPYSLILENRHPHHDGGALAGHPCKFNRTAKDRDSLAHAHKPNYGQA